MFIGTICAANYLPRAACLASSLKETQPKHTFALCLVERDSSLVPKINFPFPRVVLASEIGIPNFESFIFRHSLIEACCALKAQFVLWAFQEFPDEQQFVFLEPDVMAYSRFEELEAILEDRSKFSRAAIVVTPHQLKDERGAIGIRENTFRTLIAGTFNLGLLAVRRCQTAADFLVWWNHKLQLLCHMEWHTRGPLGDQKWALLGASFFDMTVLREPGYNVANWNVSTRPITIDAGNGQFMAGEKPLRFFHFSNMDADRDLYFFRTFLDDSSPVFSLRDDYRRRLSVFGQNEIGRSPWSYGSFASGAPISPDAKTTYWNNPQLQIVLPNPFAENNARIFERLITRPPSNDSENRAKVGYTRFRSFLTFK